MLALELATLGARTAWQVVAGSALAAVTLFALAPMGEALSHGHGPSLAIFAFHLQVIYGGGLALAAHFARALSLREALFASLFNIALSVSFGLGWHALKQGRVRLWARALPARLRESSLGIERA